MALKTTAGKSKKTDLEKEVQIAMIRHDVSQIEIADYEDVSGQAINNRLKRLNGQKAHEFKKLIAKVAAWKRERTPSKATG